MSSAPSNDVPPASRRRVVIVEDHLMFREVVRKVCIKEMGYEVVGEAGTLQEAFQCIRQSEPDLLVLDLVLPDGSGFELADEVAASRPKTQVLLISAHCESLVIERLERTRVHGFVDKRSQAIADLTSAFEALARNEPYFSPTVMQERRRLQADPHAWSKLLSDREAMVLALIARGLTDDEIGAGLGISGRTAQTHRSNILRKLGLASTPKLIAFAISSGFYYACVRNAVMGSVLFISGLWSDPSGLVWLGRFPGMTAVSTEI